MDHLNGVCQWVSVAGMWIVSEGLGIVSTLQLTIIFEMGVNALFL